MLSKSLVINLLKIFGRFRGYKIDFKSQVSKNFILSLINNSKKEYVNIISSSKIGNMEIGYGCKIKNAECTGNIKLGNFISINGPATRISSHKDFIEIKSFTSIASNVVIQEHSHNYNRLTTYYIFSNLFKEKNLNEITSKGPIIIEEDVWIGSNTTILSGVTVGRGAIIGAGSVVTQNIPRYSIAVGNPAKIIKMRFENNIIEEIEKTKWWEKKPDELASIKYLFNVDKLNLESFENYKGKL